eukprot:1793507-Prorocentrum_lima.AAC.1
MMRSRSADANGPQPTSLGPNTCCTTTPGPGVTYCCHKSAPSSGSGCPVSYTHLRAHETRRHL